MTDIQVFSTDDKFHFTGDKYLISASVRNGEEFYRFTSPPPTWREIADHLEARSVLAYAEWDADEQNIIETTGVDFAQEGDALIVNSFGDTLEIPLSRIDDFVDRIRDALGKVPALETL